VEVHTSQKDAPYADDMVRVVARHGGYVGERAAQHYSRANDTPDNSVELFTNTFNESGDLESQWHDIREPESYIRTLPEAAQPAAQAWRGAIAVRSSSIGTDGRENTPMVSLLRTAKRDIRVSPDGGKHWFIAAYVEQYRNSAARPWFTEAEGLRIAAWPTTSEYDEIIEYHLLKPAAERFTLIRPACPGLPLPVAAVPDPERPGEHVYAIGHRFWLWVEEGGA
jgi:hypothetical protein